MGALLLLVTSVASQGPQRRPGRGGLCLQVCLGPPAYFPSPGPAAAERQLAHPIKHKASGWTVTSAVSLGLAWPEFPILSSGAQRVFLPPPSSGCASSQGPSPQPSAGWWFGGAGEKPATCPRRLSPTVCLPPRDSHGACNMPLRATPEAGSSPVDGTGRAMAPLDVLAQRQGGEKGSSRDLRTPVPTPRPCL